jgi:hypothetical protein
MDTSSTKRYALRWPLCRSPACYPLAPALSRLRRLTVPGVTRFQRLRDGGPLFGQETGSGTRWLPVTVVLVDTLPPMEPPPVSVVQRRRGGRDFILLTSSRATGEVLDAAVRVLILARARQDDRPGPYRDGQWEVISIGVTATTAPSAWAQRYAQRAQEIVDDLRITPVREVPGIGPARALSFLPPRPRPAGSERPN